MTYSYGNNNFKPVLCRKLLQNLKHTPVIGAAANGHLSVVKYLVSKCGYDVNHKSSVSCSQCSCDCYFLPLRSHSHIVKDLADSTKLCVMTILTAVKLQISITFSYRDIRMLLV